MQYAWPLNQDQIGLLWTLNKSSTFYKDLLHDYPVPNGTNSTLAMTILDLTELDVMAIIDQAVLVRNLANVQVKICLVRISQITSDEAREGKVGSELKSVHGPPILQE